MPKPFDATLNSLFDIDADAWAACFARIAGIPPGPSTALDTDLATTPQADKLFRIDGASPSLLHLELEANPRLGIPRDLLRYNVLADHSSGLPVESVLILLRPKARASDQTGIYRRLGTGGRVITEFRYHVERAWERSVDFWLSAGVSLAPLALLTDEASADLESALDRFRSRIRESGADEKTNLSLIGSSYVLCGLRYDPVRVAEMYRRLSMLMEDSTTYQEILKKGLSKGISEGLSQGLSQGLTQGERKLLLRQGSIKFGAPPEMIRARLEAIDDTETLERLGEKLLRVDNWLELMSDS